MKVQVSGYVQGGAPVVALEKCQLVCWAVECSQHMSCLVLLELTKYMLLT